jgi:hypothetical protein
MPNTSAELNRCAECDEDISPFTHYKLSARSLFHSVHLYHLASIQFCNVLPIEDGSPMKWSY